MSRCDRSTGDNIANARKQLFRIRLGALSTYNVKGERLKTLPFCKSFLNSCGKLKANSNCKMTGNGIHY